MNITSDKVHSFLTWFSLGFAPFGAFFTITTWCNTRKVKTLVNSKLDKKELSENLELYLQPINDFKDRVINNNMPISQKTKNEFIISLRTFKTKFPHLSKECLNLIDNISEELTILLYKDGLLEIEECLSLGTKLSNLAILIEKEVR